jgi:hypothetical protein
LPAQKQKMSGVAAREAMVGGAPSRVNRKNPGLRERMGIVTANPSPGEETKRPSEETMSDPDETGLTQSCRVQS